MPYSITDESCLRKIVVSAYSMYRNKKVINLIIPLNLKIYNQEIARNELLIVTRATSSIYYTRETLSDD